MFSFPSPPSLHRLRTRGHPSTNKPRGRVRGSRARGSRARGSRPGSRAAAEPAAAEGNDATAAIAPGAAEPAPAAEPKPMAAPKTDDSGPIPVVRLGNNARSTPPPTAVPAAFPEVQGGVFSGTSPSSRATVYGGQDVSGSGEWKMAFHGYIRAPMRIGVQKRQEPGEGQGDYTAHEPLVPDDQYLAYQHTLHNARDWAELYFSYGNDVATGTISIQGFNFTDSAWKQDFAQFGVAQAFITVTPKLPSKSLRLLWKVGAFDNRYGTAGRYDSGELDTYLFGRTHALGEAGKLEILAKDFTISLEHGFGVNKPDPSIYNTARFTLLNHAHLGVDWKGKVELGFHYLDSFAKEEDRLGAEAGLIPPDPDGRMHVVGPDLRIDGERGYWYAFLYIGLDARTVVAPLRSAQGGGLFTQAWW